MVTDDTDMESEVATGRAEGYHTGHRNHEPGTLRESGPPAVRLARTSGAGDQ